MREVEESDPRRKKRVVLYCYAISRGGWRHKSPLETYYQRRVDGEPPLEKYYQRRVADDPPLKIPVFTE
ncbi:hypothetical protein ACP4OV_013286 [Aristida adscensionis]